MNYIVLREILEEHDRERRRRWRLRFAILAAIAVIATRAVWMG